MDRRERSANPATWSVIIGAFLGVILFLGAAYSRQPLAGLVVGIVFLAYIVVLSVLGRINVFQVLWGGTVDETKPDTNPRVIVQATAVVAVMAVVLLVYDLLSDADWGWFSWVAALTGVGYLISLMRNAGRDPEKDT